MAGRDETDEIRALVERLERGESAALAALFDIHRERLRRMVSVRLDPRLAGRVSPSDVVQDAYIDAMKRVDHYLGREDMPFGVWLRLVVGQRLVEVHRMHLQARGRDAGREVSLDRGGIGGGGVLSASAQGLAAYLVGHLTSPSQAAMRAEAQAQLEGVLDDLEPIDREVLALRHFEELDNRQTAEVLGIAPAAASKRYVRALARLREAMAGIPGFLEEMEADGDLRP